EAGRGDLEQITVVAQPVFRVQHGGDLAADARAVVHGNTRGLADVNAQNAPSPGAEHLRVHEIQSVGRRDAAGQLGDFFQNVHRSFRFTFENSTPLEAPAPKNDEASW